MARFYAQIFCLVLAVVGLGCLLLGDAGTVIDGQAQGNLGGLTLHRTWVRDGLDVAAALVLAGVGFVAARRLGRIVVTLLGAVYVALGIVGLLIGDDAAATRGFAGLHFPVAIDVFDLVVGILAILSGLGTIEEPEPPQPDFLGRSRPAPPARRG